MQSFDSAICRFWHGIFSGKKYPVAFYSQKERKALAAEVESAAKKYNEAGKPTNASRIARYFESINAYISAKNTLPNKKIRAKNIMPRFLHLLYCGKKPSAFWQYFQRKYCLPVRKSLHEFWGSFDEFQPRRLDVADWLLAHAKGKIIDIGAGSHSYIHVAIALDASAASLAKNKNAAQKLVFDINKKTRLPFAPGSFDAITLNSILSYSAKPQGLLAECRRILKPHGTLLITNAPVSDCHPAKYFEKNKISGKRLGLWLKTSGFESDDESENGVIRIVSSRAAN